MNAFPVRRGAADRAALKRSLDVLAEGLPLVLFPEGTRSEDGELQEPEMGVGMIAYRMAFADDLLEPVNVCLLKHAADREAVQHPAMRLDAPARLNGVLLGFLV